MKVWQNVIGVCCGIIAFVGIVLFAAAQFGIEERHIDSFWNGASSSKNSEARTRQTAPEEKSSRVRQTLVPT